MAGGSWLEPSWERVEPGDTVTLRGDVSTGQLGWVDGGPYYVYLSGDSYGITLDEGLGGSRTDVPLGELSIDAAGGWAQASIEVRIPNDAPPGEYWITVCNDPCRTGFGDLIGSILYVSMDPPADDGEVVVELGEPSLAALSVVERVPNRGAGLERTTHLALAPHQARATGLNGAWVAFSAGIALAVLIAIVSTRRPARADEGTPNEG